MLNNTENNEVSMMGEIASGFTFSHEVFGEGFYMADVAVGRLSGQVDIISLMVSESLIDIHKDYTGHAVGCTGQFRFHNQHEEVGNRLRLPVLVREIHLTQPVPMDCTKNNQIFLDGHICKPSVYKRTPLEKEIADILLAINRLYDKPDYIPCICRGRNARRASEFEVGTRIETWGRVQSRGYTKELSKTETGLRTVYEVSILKLKRREENEGIY